MRILTKIPTPDQLREELSLTNTQKENREHRIKEIKDILAGRSKKLLLIIGPCSADDYTSVLEYTYRLADLQQKISDKILIVPRIYTCKPRTTGDGYKGMLHQPDLSCDEDIREGLKAVRRLHAAIINETGLYAAEEMLYPNLIAYIQDLIVYSVVGARSVENQQHRLTASLLDFPIGMKNPMDGNISVMLNSIQSAQQPHRFVFNEYEVESDGNQYTHAILRGLLNESGQSMPNYHYEDLKRLHINYQSRNLTNTSVVIDCNHNNSGKQFLEQIRIAKEIISIRNYDSDIKKLVKGLMVESYLVDGRQNLPKKIYGQSITDPCLGWDKTEKLVYDIVELMI